MATNGKILVGGDHDYQNAGKPVNIQAGSASGDAVEYDQLNTALSGKQDNVASGSGIAIEGTTVKVNLATAGDDFTTFNVTDAAFASLIGTYTRLGYQAYLEYAGTNLDLTYGGDFNGYYKDNGGGVWSVIFRREIDGNAATSDSGSWLMVLVTVDPTTVIGNVSSFVPNYQAVDYDTISTSDVVAENTFRSPSAGGSGFNSDAEYATGSTPAGLKFDNNKLALDFASEVANASSTKVFPSIIIKTYVDEQISDAKDLSNHPFNNAVAQLTGDPANAQSAFESLANEIDSLNSAANILATVDLSHTAHIQDNTDALGISQGESNLGAFTPPATAFLGGSNAVKPALQALGNSLADVYSNMGDIIGVSRGEGSQYRPAAGAGQNGIVISYDVNDEDMILTAATGGLSRDNNIVDNADIAGTYLLLKDNEGSPIHGNLANILGNGYAGLSEDTWFIGRNNVINQPAGTGMTSDLNDYQVFYKVMDDLFGAGVDGWLVATVTRGGGGTSDDWRIFLVDVDPHTWTSTSHIKVMDGADDSARVTLFDTASQTEEEIIGGMGEFNTPLIEDKSTAKEALESLGVQLEVALAGQGQFWTPVDVHSNANVNIANPATDTFGGSVVTQGGRALLLGQTDPIENGIYVFDTTSTAMVRASDANEDVEFTALKTVQVLNSTEDGISGATFAYDGADLPEVGTDALSFSLKAKGVVGDNTITTGKLATALAQTIENKADKQGADVTLVADTPFVVSHSLDSSDVLVQFKNTSGELVNVEVVINSSSQVTLRNSVGISGRVVIIG